jgi:hypothetical protein
VFHGINFGVLDYAPAEGPAGAVQLEFSIVSHTGERVLSKTIPLRPRGELAHTASDSELKALRASLLAQIAQGEVDAECVAYWGVVPLWRTLLYRAIIAVALLLFVVAPVVVVLWCVGASLYYVFRGKELARRDAVEKRYQQLKKQA